MGDHEHTVSILGTDGRLHDVDATRADDFHHADTGLPLSDEEYDETQRRLVADNDHLIPEAFRTPKE